MSEFLAHTPSNSDRKYFHKLRHHLKKTGIRASRFGRNEMEKKVLFIAGVLHDLGKYKTEFQEYLRAEHKQKGSGKKSPHAIYGAVASQRFGFDEVSYSILGHHAGLYDKADWQSKCKELLNTESGVWEELFNLMQKDFNETRANEKIEKAKTEWKDSELYSILKKDKFLKDLFIRFMFSCLTDSDYIDSESFFDKQLSSKRKSFALGTKSFVTVKKYETSTIEYDTLINKLETYISKTLDTSTSPLNTKRTELRKYAISYSNKPIGFYSLNLPTGMGKTITSISWALEHAKANKLNRIIMVLPFLSIIDQSAKILKAIFGKESVLEHHSNFQFKKNENDETNYDYLKLAIENWDFPIIVTTNVQFLESAFNNKPSRLRKFHNICNSVVIFDEVQTFPKDMILPTLTMLKNISEFLNTSFLFCTATQPAFETRKGFTGIDKIFSLVENPAQLFADSIRVDYEFYKNLEPIPFNDFIDNFNMKSESTLVVFNSKPDALNFYKNSGNHFDKKLHLSTYMCPAHRKLVIWLIKRYIKERTILRIESINTETAKESLVSEFKKESKPPKAVTSILSVNINNQIIIYGYSNEEFKEIILDSYEELALELNKKQKNINTIIDLALLRLNEKKIKRKNILVSSTQLIEAGVDLDFPIVYRAIAPLDSIIQSAGRCNREGKLKNENGESIKGKVFIFNLENLRMPADKIYKKSTEFTKTFLQNKDMLSSYDVYLKYYDALLTNKRFIDGDDFNINNAREQFEFKTVAENYKIIEDGLTKSVFIKDYNKKSKLLYRKIQSKPYLSREDYREIQLYSVQVYNKDFDKLDESFAIEPNEEKGLFILKKEWYNKEFGIDIERIPSA